MNPHQKPARVDLDPKLHKSVLRIAFAATHADYYLRADMEAAANVELTKHLQKPGASRDKALLVRIAKFAMLKVQRAKIQSYGGQRPRDRVCRCTCKACRHGHGATRDAGTVIEDQPVGCQYCTNAECKDPVCAQRTCGHAWGWSLASLASYEKVWTTRSSGRARRNGKALHLREEFGDVRVGTLNEILARKPEGFTDDDFILLDMICDGYKQREMATRLGITQQAVNKRLKGLIAKIQEQVVKPLPERHICRGGGGNVASTQWLIDLFGGSYHRLVVNPVDARHRLSGDGKAVQPPLRKA